MHEGFAYAAIKIYDYFKQNIAKLIPSDATFSVIGHSLGGAVAVLLGILLKNDKDFNYKIKSVITFGQPMVCIPSSAPPPQQKSANQNVLVNSYIGDRQERSDAMEYRREDDPIVSIVESEGPCTYHPTAQPIFLSPASWFWMLLSIWTSSPLC